MKKSRNTNYIITTINENTKMFLHRYILGYNGNEDIDHINLDGTDNRKINLRIISHADNIRNQSVKRKGIKKVPSGKYQVSITKNYHCIYLGTYDTYDEALAARLNAE